MLKESRPQNQESQESQDKIVPNLAEMASMSPGELAQFFDTMSEQHKLPEFLETAAENPEAVAQMSYWEKWLKEGQRKLVDQVVEKKREAYGEQSESLPLELEKKFTPDELKLILSNLGAIQLTFGCSKGCPFCAFDAVPGVREHIPYSQLTNLFKKYGNVLGENMPILYWASEPSDYLSGDKTYEDVHQLAVEYAGYSPHITSKETRDDEWLKFMSANKGSARVSVFGMPLKLVAETEHKLESGVVLTGVGKGHARGLGVDSTKMKGKSDLGGIGCFNGVCITPRGIYSVAQGVVVSENLPQAQVFVPLEEIGDITIRSGDNLSDILRKSIVIYPHSSYSIDNPSEYSDIYIQTAINIFRVRLNKNGKIERAKILGQAEGELLKGLIKNERREKVKSSEYVAERRRRLGEYEKIKKEYEQEMGGEIFQVINKIKESAIENGKIDFAFEDRLTEEDKKRLIESIKKTDLSLYRPYIDSPFLEEGLNKIPSKSLKKSLRIEFNIKIPLPQPEDDRIDLYWFFIDYDRVNKTAEINLSGSYG